MSIQGVPSAWPAGTDVLVLGGLPTGDPEGLDEGQVPLPEDTTNVVKLLREQGLAVVHAVAADRRVEVGRWSADYLMPILMFAQEAIAGGAGNILASIILERMRHLAPGAQLHVRVAKVRTKDMQADWFEADGPPDKVIEALQHGFGD
jgi:hypothetical protein